MASGPRFTVALLRSPGRVALFSRSREDMTASFPELVEAFAGFHRNRCSGRRNSGLEPGVDPYFDR